MTPEHTAPAVCSRKILSWMSRNGLGALIETRMRSRGGLHPLRRHFHSAGNPNPDRKSSIRRICFCRFTQTPRRQANSSGVETYYLNFTTSKAAMEVAARENASSQKTVYELKDLLQKIALQDKVDESREFAARIQQQSVHCIRQGE